MGGYKFPEKFFAFQEVTVQAKKKTIKLIAQISRSEGQIQVIFLDPLWQRPLVYLEKSRVTWYVTKVPELDAHLPSLFQSMHYIFSHEATPNKRQQVTQGVVYELRGIKTGADKCDFPEKIRINYRRALQVEVLSSQVSCD